MSLTRLVVRNFKRFRDVSIDLADPVVFIGPNNSGKTTALQALALWQVGVRRWLEKRSGKTPEKRPGVTINRKDVLSAPVPSANLLWRDLHVREVHRDNGKQRTQNICIEILVEGAGPNGVWTAGLEFDYANEESFYCRPLFEPDGVTRMPVPAEAGSVKVTFLPPMSGLSAQETRLDPGALNVRLGEGRTAEVLRNLCYRILHPEEPGSNTGEQDWAALTRHVERLFGVRLNMPRYVAERGEIAMSYSEVGTRGELDLSSAGRGLHQTLLVLAYLYANPGSVLLLDEPDAHLEILRQREIYGLLCDLAQQQKSQVIAASHSEIVLNEAQGRHLVVAFVGTAPRSIDRGSQLHKALGSIGFEHYYAAEIAGWVLFVEGSTDLDILRSFARTLKHPALEFLDRPAVHYVENQPQRAKETFYGLRLAKPNLVGFALFDRLDRAIEPAEGLTLAQWRRREIENYLCAPEVLESFAASLDLPLLGGSDQMRECIAELVPPIALRDRSHSWWSTVKASDEFLDPLFDEYFRRLGTPNVFRKKSYHELAHHLDAGMIDPEVVAVLDSLVVVARAAQPAQ